MDFSAYIKPELLILIPVLYLIGLGLKRSAFPDKFIPTLLGAAGVALAILWVISTTDVYGIKNLTAGLFAAITQGVLCAGASVFANQIFKQSGKDE